MSNIGQSSQFLVWQSKKSVAMLQLYIFDHNTYFVHILYHTHNYFTALFPGLPGRASARRRNLLLDFMMQGKITEADTLTIWLTATPSGLISDPPPSSPCFYAGCPSLGNPPTLSWLGTGTKYAGLNTQWLGFVRILYQVQCTNLACNRFTAHSD